jgi:hypothetical protein
LVSGQAISRIRRNGRTTRKQGFGSPSAPRNQSSGHYFRGLITVIYHYGAAKHPVSSTDRSSIPNFLCPLHGASAPGMLVIHTNLCRWPPSFPPFPLSRPSASLPQFPSTSGSAVLLSFTFNLERIRERRAKVDDGDGIYTSLTNRLWLQPVSPFRIKKFAPCRSATQLPFAHLRPQLQFQPRRRPRTGHLVGVLAAEHPELW